MSKHKKTRKEKNIADYRHQVYTLKNQDFSLGSPTMALTLNENSYSNPHISKDVLKTTILTFAIITAQIILFFLLNRHIITLPIVKY